jgi:hypothetical protein
MPPSPNSGYSIISTKFGYWVIPTKSECPVFAAFFWAKVGIRKHEPLFLAIPQTTTFATSPRKLGPAILSVKEEAA